MTMDEKQWLVSRLDVSHESIFNDFQLSKEDFIRIREDITTSITNRRSYILSGVVFVITLLGFLYETKFFDRYIISWFLIPDLIIGLVTFLISSKYIDSNEKAFIAVENSIISAQQALGHNYGILLHESLDLKSISTDTLKNYAEFMKALAGIVYIPFGNALKNSSKTKWLDPYYKKLFADNAKIFEETIDSAIALFNGMDQRSLPPRIREYAKNTISEYTKITN